MEDDRSIADLLSTVASRYKRQLLDPDVPINRTRLETIRKLELIAESIRGLMKYDQEAL